MKGCLEVLFVLLLGVGLAAWLVWDAWHQPVPGPAATSTTSADPAAVKKELDLLKRQFQRPEDYQQRLAGQKLSEAALTNRIAQALARQHDLAQARRPISEAQAHAWFEAHGESLRIPETFHAAHVFLTCHEAEKPDREPEIRAIHRQLLDRSLTFREAAARYSEDERTKPLAGDLGWFAADRMPADFIAAVRSLKPGETSPPVLTRLGWHVIHLIERRPSRLPTFTAARAEIMAALESLDSRPSIILHPRPPPQSIDDHETRPQVHSPPQ